MVVAAGVSDPFCVVAALYSTVTISPAVPTLVESPVTAFVAVPTLVESRASVTLKTPLGAGVAVLESSQFVKLVLTPDSVAAFAKLAHKTINMRSGRHQRWELISSKTHADGAMNNANSN